MSEAIITVEGLGKRYRLGQKSNERYTALRDVLTDKAKSLFGKRKTEKLKSGNGFDAENLTSGIGPLTSARAAGEEFWALRDVSFEVRRGEVVGIIGRNGAGKSTLLKILSRITEPTEGRVRIRGRVASLLEVGTGFHPELTGRENIYLNGAILGMTRVEIQKKFDEIVDFAEIAKFLDTPVKRYSSGMYVRLAFAVAAHLEPEILVVDEVLAVGDAEFQKKCLGKMEQVSRGGRTVLFVSHNMTAIKTLCHRAILIKEGTILRDGDTTEVTEHYVGAAREDTWETSWSLRERAPGDSTVWLKCVRVIPEGVANRSSVDISVPLRIVTQYNVLVPIQLNVSLVIYTGDGQCVFNTVSEVKQRQVGLHEDVCRIPGGLLNDETYSVRVLLVADGSRPIVDKEHVVTFELQDIPRAGSWLGKWIGAIRPSFDWQTRRLEPDVEW